MSCAVFSFFNVAGATVWATLYGAGVPTTPGGKLHLFTRYIAIGSALAAVILVAAAVIFLRRQEDQIASEAERALPGPLKTP